MIMYPKRTPDQIKRIEDRIIEPYVIQNFITQEEVDHLVSVFENTEQVKTQKVTGPITLDIKFFDSDPIVQKIMAKLEAEIGKFDITAGFFFTATYPHIIHNDDLKELPEIYRGITIPLKLYGFSGEYPKLCFFDQFYFHGPVKLFAGSEAEDIPGFYNYHIFDYQDVAYKTTEPFPAEAREKYFTHLRAKWLEGLSFHSAIDWVPTSAMIFDSTRIHCASDFRKNGISMKLAISIFTKKID